MNEQATPDGSELPITGGSAASQAYRAELARQGRLHTLTPLPQAPVAVAAKPAVPTIDARAAERKKVNGRARVLLPTGEAVVGKMVDLSVTGACVMLEEMFPSKKTCTLEIDIFHAGSRHAFSVPAVSVYGVLASGKGFKVGFQFGPVGEPARKTLNALLA